MGEGTARAEKVSRLDDGGKRGVVIVAAQDGGAGERSSAKEGGGGSYQELARIIERLHRRFLDVIRVELSRRGTDDISPTQLMMLFSIGQDEISVRDLIERGHYLGSNASYNLKHLVENGYVDRSASPRDRRAARLRLSPKGHELCNAMASVEQEYIRVLARTEEDAKDLEATYRVLKRLERAWTGIIHYNDAGMG
jgi:DNA-binding MarR family transcriptional regulator